MKVSINIDKIGKGLDAMIIEELENNKLPPCLGNMTPPLLSRVINVDDSIVFKPKSSVPDEQVIRKASEIIVKDVDDVHQVDPKFLNDIEGVDLVLTKEGLDYIEDYKEKRAHQYVEHVSGCLTCELIDVCYKLTKNFLALVRLEGLFKG